MQNQTIEYKPYSPDSFRLRFKADEKPNLPVDLLCGVASKPRAIAEFNACELLKTDLCWLEIDDRDTYSLCAANREDFYKAVGITCERLAGNGDTPPISKDSRFYTILKFILAKSELLTIYILKLVMGCSLAEARQHAAYIRSEAATNSKPNN